MICLVIAIVIFVCSLIINKTNESGIFDDYPDAQTNLDNAERALLSYDNLFIFIIVGLSLFVIISSSIVYNHPAFLVLGMFLLFIAVSFAAVVSNTFWIFSVNHNLAAVAASFPKIQFLMINLPIYIAFMGSAAAVAAYIGFKQQ